MIIDCLGFPMGAFVGATEEGRMFFGKRDPVTKSVIEMHEVIQSLSFNGDGMQLEKESDNIPWHMIKRLVFNKIDLVVTIQFQSESEWKVVVHSKEDFQRVIDEAIEHAHIAIEFKS